MSGFGALWYLESRQIGHRIQRTLRQPGRAIVYAIAIAYFAIVSVARSRSHQLPAFLRAVPEPYASALLFAFVILVGIIAYGAASGIAGTFSSTADARFLTGSLISPRLVVAWLQLRRCGAGVLRMLFTLVVYALLFSHTGTSGGVALAIIGGTIVAAGTAVPMLEVRKTAGARTAQSLAGAVIAAGLLPFAIVITSLGDPRVAESARGLIDLHFGAALNALIIGNPLALAALYAFAVLFVLLAFLSGGDLYPELYAASLRILNFRERRQRISTLTIEHRYEMRSAEPSRSVFGRLGGPWTIAWKELIAFERSPSLKRTFFLGAFACAAVGAIFGNVAVKSSDPLAASIAFGSMAVNILIVFVALASAVGLATDLRKPLWWMGPDPLWKRLFAWLAATSWRMGGCVAAAIVAWLLAMHQPVLAAMGIPLAAAAVLHLRAIGLGLYAVFPSSIDQRGPLAMIRALLTYLFAVPPIAAGVLAAIFLHSTVLGLAVGIAFSLTETMLLVAFAAARISGQGVAFALSEAS